MGTPGCGEELRRDAFPGNQLCAFLGFWGGRNALRRFILCVGLMGRCSGQVCPHRGAERSRRPPSVGPRPVHEGLRRAKRRRRRNPRSAELERGSSPASRSGSPPPGPGLLRLNLWLGLNPRRRLPGAQLAGSRSQDISVIHAHRCTYPNVCFSLGP